MQRKKAERRERRRRRLLYSGCGAILCAVLWRPPAESAAPLPGTVERGPARSFEPGEARVLFDLTGVDPETGARVKEQEIFDDLLRAIAGAERFIALDFFLWNDWGLDVEQGHHPLARELAEALIARKEQRPGIPILVLTDPLNRLYGDHLPEEHRRMQDVGIHLVYTDLFPVPEPNVLYGRPARRLAPLLGKLPGLDCPLLPNPLDRNGQRLSMREFARLLHFKANHRKVMVADDGQALRVWVTSQNPAGTSSAHDNMAVSVTGNVARDALQSLYRVWRWSSKGTYAVPAPLREAALRDWQEALAVADVLADNQASQPAENRDRPTARWLTEGAIRKDLLKQLAACRQGDEVAVMLFYLSDREVIAALKQAARDGAQVRVILDFNRDAFGRRKIGVPNRPVAAGLAAAGRETVGSLEVRWAETHGEQFHHKTLAIRNRATQRYVLLTGSANWTRRNLQDYNLEANLLIEDAPTMVNQVFHSFDRLWTNQDRLFTAPYERHAEPGWTLAWKSVLGRLLEASGAGTF